MCISAAPKQVLAKPMCAGARAKKNTECNLLMHSAFAALKFDAASSMLPKPWVYSSESQVGGFPHMAAVPKRPRRGSISLPKKVAKKSWTITHVPIQLFKLSRRTRHGFCGFVESAHEKENACEASKQKQRFIWLLYAILEEGSM